VNGKKKLKFDGPNGRTRTMVCMYSFDFWRPTYLNDPNF
jgi:hypothetical protein